MGPIRGVPASGHNFTGEDDGCHDTGPCSWALPPSTELAPASHPTAEGTTHFADRFAEAWLSGKSGCPFLVTGNDPGLGSSTVPLKGLC